MRKEESRGWRERVTRSRDGGRGQELLVKGGRREGELMDLVFRKKWWLWREH